MEKWKEVFVGIIPKAVYQVQLINGEKQGLTIKLSSSQTCVMINFGMVQAVRMLDEGIVQSNLYSENEIRKFQKQADFLRVCGSRRRKKETRAAGLRPHGNKRRYKRNSGNVQNGFARFQIQGFRQERHADCRHDSRKPFGHTSERNRAFDKAVSVCQRKRQAGRHSA